MSASADKHSFFRQSSWMIAATAASGVFMMGVQMLAIRMEKGEYGVFVTLLRLFLLMGFPAGGLQIVFAQQTAAAVTEEDRRKLTASIRALIRGAFLIWALMVVTVFLFRESVLVSLKISNPAALWITMLLGLASLWAPIFRGLLQGSQNFFGLGWMLMIDGAGRFAATAGILQFGGQAAGAMAGALVGQTISLGLGFWLTAPLWKGPAAHFAWKPWLKRTIPLSAGIAVVLIMTSADVIFVQALFPREATPFYMAGAMIGMAMVIFTTPLASVMFPRIVKSAALARRTDALQQALIATAVLGTGAAALCSLFPVLPLRLIYFRNPDYWQSAPLVPWFAWGLLPLILVNVLLGNLLAKGRFRAVPWMVGLAVSYGAALWLMRPALLGLEPFSAFKLILGALGLFGLAQLFVAGWFTRFPTRGSPCASR